jgi:hypothetical protein
MSPEMKAIADRQNAWYNTGMGGPTQYMEGMSPDSQAKIAQLDAEHRTHDLRGVLSLRDIRALRERNVERQRAMLEDMRARGVALLSTQVGRKP